MKPISCLDARLTLQFLPIVAGVRWKLWRTPFARLHGQWRELVQRELEQAATSPKRVFAQDEDALKAEVWRHAHAVQRAARLVPHGSCLTQAMALQLILAQRGEPCLVRIGVDRNRGKKTGAAENTSVTASSVHDEAGPIPADTSRFEAHAWVEWRERVVLGGDISRWKPLTVFAPVAVPASNPTAIPLAPRPLETLVNADRVDAEQP